VEVREPVKVRMRLMVEDEVERQLVLTSCRLRKDYGVAFTLKSENGNIKTQAGLSGLWDGRRNPGDAPAVDYDGRTMSARSCLRNMTAVRDGKRSKEAMR